MLYYDYTHREEAAISEKEAERLHKLWIAEMNKLFRLARKAYDHGTSLGFRESINGEAMRMFCTDRYDIVSILMSDYVDKIFNYAFKF